jgi:hypothetical protein
MALTLTPGTEMRLDGAPDQLLPANEDRIRAIAARLLEDDAEGVLFGGDIRNAIPNATQIVMDEDRARLAAGGARATANAADRASQRRAARGVVPEDLPPGEFGVASGRTVEEANRPQDQAIAALEIEQDTADNIIGGLRRDKRNWDAESQYQFLQERGEQNPMAAQGDRDVDLRRSIMQQRGQFFEMPDGTMIPVGREPTAADFRNERAWRKWVSENPGSERQARYDPQGYETYREGVREDIRENAQEEMATYGTGVSDPAVRAELGIAPLAPEQATARNRRDRSEDRVREAQRGRFYAQRLQNDTGMPAGTDIAAMEAERFRQRDAANKEDLAQRRALVAQRGELRGAGLSPAVGDMRNRFDSLIDRLGQENMTDWQRAGIIAGLAPEAQTANPTPLGVDSANMQLAAPVIRSVLAGAAQSMDPAAQADRELRNQMMLAQMAPEQRVALSIAQKQPMGTGHSAAHVGARFNYWLNDPGVRWEAAREQKFRQEMEGLGYQPAEIDTFLDARRGEEEPEGLPPGSVPGAPSVPMRRAPPGPSVSSGPTGPSGPF